MTESTWPEFSGRLLTDPAQTGPFVTDQRGRWTGRPLAVAQPDSTADVARILRWCAARQVPVVPQGGNTGLVGGSIPDGSGRALLLSLTRLNRVRRIDPLDNTLVADAGCTLTQLQLAAEQADRQFALSLASQGSCTLGGNLSTNAGGVQVLRYGNARELCLGLELVTAQGDVWDGLRGLRKDNTGYDLRDLFIGAEGTLGVITAATMKLFARPAAQLTALAALPSPAHALRLLTLARTRLDASLTAFELFSDLCLQLVHARFADNRSPFSDAHPYYVLLECSDPESADHAADRFESLLAQALDNAVINDAVVASSLAHSRAFWALRENISQAQAWQGKNIKHDISLPISAIDRFITQTNAAIVLGWPGARPVVFGHLGDGNLHYNISPPPGVDPDAFMRQEIPINRLVYDAVSDLGGSISAEHGIGALKVQENQRRKSPVELALMRRVKQALDPQGLMNPGRVLAAGPG